MVYGVTLLAVLAVAALAVVLLSTPSDDELRDSARLAARTYTTSLTTYDAATLDDTVERVQRASTEEFGAQYAQTIDGLRARIDSERLSSQGDVVAVGIEEIDDDRATLIVAVDQQIASAGAPPRTEANRVRMVLVRRDGNWTVDDVERL
jgi:hypothetical protein